MPYEIKEVRGKKFSVVNKDTNKVMSKGTTKQKAQKQVKAIYANMKPEHRLRHRVSQLQDIHLKSPVHRAVFKMASGMLKQEEVYGDGMFGDAWSWVKSQANKLNFLDVKQYPVMNLVLAETAQHPAKYIGEAVKEYGSLALEILAPELAPAIEIGRVASKLSSSSPVEEKLPKEVEDDESIAERLDRVIEKIQTQTSEERVGDNQMSKMGSIPQEIYVDQAIRFPLLYNYDENSRPMPLAEWLLMNGVSGSNFSQREFGNTYLNQKPYAFLDHPLNGGNLGKIDYSRLGYSKY